ncbi:VOC family protein [Paludibaculum fermentans]|uniref:VOC family protein n=1 Tax=Paludibaculum fermentans TaxID=1473598 RepID=A0A7S7NKW4_PALFE|nr:VOC family protein [Paludibaculum fermentans]QOY85516.1 VOC family protein [Paludibaculum fermentans]
MILGIEHTAIASPDPAALAQWYVDTLGFVINYRGSTAFFVKAPNGTMIEIIPAEGDRGGNTLKTPGLRHLALTVGDFEAALAELRAKNVHFLSEPSESKGNKVVFFTDPEGNILHLLYRATPLA